MKTINIRSASKMVSHIREPRGTIRYNQISAALKDQNSEIYSEAAKALDKLKDICPVKPLIAALNKNIRDVIEALVSVHQGQNIDEHHKKVILDYAREITCPEIAEQIDYGGCNPSVHRDIAVFEFPL